MTGEIYIPGSVTAIDFVIFSFCKKLTGINVDINNLNYSSKDGIVYNKNLTSLILCPQGKTGDVYMPDSVNSVNVAAFQNCSELTKINISYNVTSIGRYAFSGCGSLTNINLPGHITYLSAYVFENCSKLENIVLPDEINTIDNSALYGCSSLTNLTLPPKLKEINFNAMADCTNLKSVTLFSKVKYIAPDAFLNCRDLTINSYTGSYTHEYAKKNNINFISLISEWAEPEIKDAMSSGIVPESIIDSIYARPITRLEFCELIMAVYYKLSGERTVNTKNPFMDTGNEDAIAAYYLGIVQGVEEGIFNTDRNILREEMAKMLTGLVKAYQKDKFENAADTENSLSFFNDADSISPWAKEYVAYMAKTGFMKGNELRCFVPLGNTSVEEAVAVAYRILIANKT